MNEEKISQGNEMEEEFLPVPFTDVDAGVTYQLDFDRSSIRFAEMRQFTIEDLLKFPKTKTPEFFFYAFRKNHQNVSREKTDTLLKKAKGIPSKQFNQLVTLFRKYQFEDVIQPDEDAEKNASVMWGE